MKLLWSTAAASLAVSAVTATATGSLSTYDRKVGAILGSMVADAAVMPLHWIYNQTEIADLVGNTDPAFHEPPSCPYYNYTFGENTQYGQEQLTYLRAMAKAGGVDAKEMQQVVCPELAE